MKQAEDLATRLWRSVDKTGDCWIWQGAKSPYGYGRISIAGMPRTRRTRLVHRVVYELENGTIPEGMSVMHTCDTPSCVNPDHLRLGTHAENMRDMDMKRRCVRVGEKRRLFTEDQVREILSSPESSRVIGERFGVSARAVRSLRQNGGYKGVTGSAW